MYVIRANGFYWNGKGFGGFGLSKRYSTYNKATLGLRVAKKYSSATLEIATWSRCFDEEFK